MKDKEAIIAGFRDFINGYEILEIDVDETISKNQFSPLYQAMTGKSQEVSEKTITIKYYSNNNA